MNECFFASRARNDFNKILSYIGERDWTNAVDFTTRLQLTCVRLAGMPKIGRKHDDLATGLRSFPVGKYIIFYRAISDDIEIVRILHASRNIDRLFFE